MAAVAISDRPEGRREFISDKISELIMGAQQTNDHVSFINELKYARVETAADYRWRLPGRGSAKDDCGQYKSLMACAAGHKKVILHSCARPDCPICFTDWAKRAAGRIYERLQQIITFEQRENRVLYHWTVSPEPGKLRNWDEMKAFLKTVVTVFKRGSGKNRKLAIDGTNPWFGAIAFFHSHRGGKLHLLSDMQLEDENDSNFGKKWRIGAHFHIISNIESLPTACIKAKYGFVTKRISAVNNPLGLLTYEISHVGVPDDRSKKFESVWLGTWSYNQFFTKIEKKTCQAHCHFIDKTKLPEIDKSGPLGNLVMDSIEEPKYKPCGLPLFWCNDVQHEQKLLHNEFMVPDNVTKKIHGKWMTFKNPDRKYVIELNTVKILSYFMTDDPVEKKIELKRIFPKRNRRFYRHSEEIENLSEISVQLDRFL